MSRRSRRSPGHVATGRATVGRTLHLSVLGPLEVTGPGGPVAVAGRRQRVLLSVLASQVGDVVSVPRLADALWGERPPPSHVQVVHSVVMQLRRLLGGAVIETRPGGYALRVPPDAVDVTRFDALVRRGRAAAADHDVAAAAEAFTLAMALWRGSPHEELNGWEPVATEVARLEEERRSVAEERAEVEIACGRHRPLVATLEVLCREEPLREARWALLMVALDRSGQHADALRAFQRARAALAEVGLEPGSVLTSVERDIAADVVPIGSPPAAASCAPPLPGNLVRSATELVGRVAELAERIRDVSTHRLVTFTGTAGVGKTRLVAEVAWSVRSAFADGAWFVPLAPVADPSDVVAAVASTLSIKVKPGMAMTASVVEELRDRHLLLVLDSCEHVVDAAGGLVDAIVRACPEVTVVTTTREPLGAPDEHVVVVPALDPSTDGVALFSARASAVDDSFVAGEDDRLTIATICHRLDGIPLAIELAAAHARASTPVELLDRLDDRFRLLRRRGSAVDARHRSLRAALDSSYHRLDEVERLVFDRLSVFTASFDSAAVVAVCGGGLDRSDVLDALESLVERSLVVTSRSPRGIRYALLESLRAYGRERLDSRGGAERPCDRHLAHYREVAARAHERWAGPQQLEAHRTFDDEWENLRTAHGWAVSSGRPDAASALVADTGPHALCRLVHEHAEWAARTIAAAPGGVPVHPTTYGWAAYWALVAGEPDRAIVLARRGGPESPSPLHPDTAWSWAVLVLANTATGRGVEAQALAERSRAVRPGDGSPRSSWCAQVGAVESALAVEGDGVAASVERFVTWARRVGAPSLLARAAYYEAQAQMASGSDLSEPAALASYARALELAREAGDVNVECRSLGGVVGVTTMMVVPEREWPGREAVARLFEVRAWSALWASLETVPWRFLTMGAPEVAAVIWGHIEAHRPPWHAAVACRARAEGLRLAHEHPHAELLLSRGAAMTDVELVRFVLDELDARAEVPVTATRERERILSRIVGRRADEPSLV